MSFAEEMMSGGTLAWIQGRLERISGASEDAMEIGSAARLRHELAARAREAAGCEDGLIWVDLADAALKRIIGRLQLAAQTAVRHSKTTDRPRAAVQHSVAEIRDDVLRAANSFRRGRPLFAGYAAGDAVARVDGGWRYVGDAGRIKRRASASDIIAVNLVGDEVFGFAAGEDVFTVLDGLLTALAIDDHDEILRSVVAIGDSIERISEGLEVLDAARRRLRAALDCNQVEQQSLRRCLSEIEVLERAEAVSELQVREVSYQATVDVLLRALQPSLIDFLR